MPLIQVAALGLMVTVPAAFVARLEVMIGAEVLLLKVLTVAAPSKVSAPVVKEAPGLPLLLEMIALTLFATLTAPTVPLPVRVPELKVTVLLLMEPLTDSVPALIVVAPE